MTGYDGRSMLHIQQGRGPPGPLLRGGYGLSKRGPIRPSLGERIRHERQRRGLSAWGLARRCPDGRVSPGTIYRIETGKQHPHMSTVQVIAEGLGIPVEDLVAGTEVA